MAVIEEDPLQFQSVSKRKRYSRDNKKSHDPMSLTDLPSNVLVQILARLPLRTLLVARSVCKAFVFLTTPNPHFTNLHSSYADQILVFQFGGSNTPSSLLCVADQVIDCENSQLKPFFQLPKIEEPDYKNRILSVPVLPFPELGTACFWDLKRLFLANSCNGLLFFRKNEDAGDYGSLVCNPFTNEYIVIPDVDPETRLLVSRTKGLWLGFSPATNQYKVVRIFQWKNGSPDEVAAQVFVIGSGSWKQIDDPHQLYWRRRFFRDLCQTQLLNGLMYWYHWSWSVVISFDFEREKFGEVVLPAEFQVEGFQTKHSTSIGVLGGFPCLSCNDFAAHRVDLWVMNRDSWRKEFVVDTAVGPGGGPVYGRFMPLQFLGNGEILILWNGDTLVCYDPRTEALRYFELHRLNRSLKVVALTPSFVPLKDALKVDKVLSLRPRYNRSHRGDEKEL